MAPDSPGPGRPAPFRPAGGTWATRLIFWLVGIGGRYDPDAVPEAFPEPTDAELVERVLNGDQDAFAQLLRRHHKTAYALVRRILPPWCAIDAADLVQDIFLKTYSRLDSFDRTRSFPAWFLTIARNASIDRLRKCHRELGGPRMAVPHADPRRLSDDAAREEYSRLIRRSHQWVDRYLDAALTEVRRGAHFRIDRVDYFEIAQQCGYSTGESARVTIRTAVVAAMPVDEACGEARDIQSKANALFNGGGGSSERQRKLLFLNVLDVDTIRCTAGEAHG